MVAVMQLELPGQFLKMNIASVVVVEQIGGLLSTLAPAAAHTGKRAPSWQESANHAFKSGLSWLKKHVHLGLRQLVVSVD